MTLSLSKEKITEQSLSFEGVLDSSQADSILQSAFGLIQKNMELFSKIRSKEIFSCFVELVQNVAEYNRDEWNGELENSHILLELGPDYAYLKTSNYILPKDVEELELLFKTLFNLDPDTLQMKYKNALLQGNSLGLLMLRKIKFSKFNWKLETVTNNRPLLHLEMILNYGAITN